MTIAVVTHAACLDHDPGPGHPERNARLKAVLQALKSDEELGLIYEEAPRASAEQLSRVHAADYVGRILSLNVTPGTRLALDPDTILSERSVEAALRGAGGAIHAVDLVMTGTAAAAFVAVRPPGHHAERARAMGFCLFNNVAIAALHGRERWGLRRIAVADFDVHHGNGTQQTFWAEPELFFASSHQSPCYPGTGTREERGIADNIVNAPLPPGTGSDGFRQAWERLLLPALDAFAPEFLIISAGFDAHRADPLAQLMLDAPDFAWITRELVALAARHCGGRVISVLEGGYDLDATATSAVAHARQLSVARDGPVAQEPQSPSESQLRA